MSCPACATNKVHPTWANDVVICIRCREMKTARHNHVMCIDCESGKPLEVTDG